MNWGERHYNAKLSSDDIALIREAGERRARLLAEARSYSNRALAEKFEVSKSHIDQILRFCKRRNG
jgi:hypothetical protein